MPNKYVFEVESDMTTFDFAAIWCSVILEKNIFLNV